MSSLQTARVTKKGNVGFALGYGGILNNDYPVNSVSLLTRFSVFYFLHKNTLIGVDNGYLL